MIGGRTLILPLLVGLAGVASASIFGPDDRLVMNHGRGNPFAPIGVAYDASSDRYGTAFLVDACHVLTAEHLTGDGRADARGARFDFFIGQRGRWNFEKKTTATVIESGGFTERQWNRDADWLLLRLDECVGHTYGHVRLHGGRQASSDAPFQSAGYPSERLRGTGMLVVDPHCNLVGRSDRLWLNTCAGLAGDSGGPLFRLGSDGLAIDVYAIQAAANPEPVSHEPDRRDFDPADPFTGLNEAVPVANILPKIRKHIRPGES